MLTDRRRPYKQGNSTVLALPKGLVLGETSTLAANDLLLVDPRGRIEPELLGAFMEKEIEPRFRTLLARNAKAAKRSR